MRRSMRSAGTALPAPGSGSTRTARSAPPITEATGIPATTATLALHDALRALGARRVGLVTPYLGSVQAAILRNLAQAGLEPGPERHLEDPGNYTFAEHPDALVRR
jgi:maleate isomerase